MQYSFFLRSECNDNILSFLGQFLLHFSFSQRLHPFPSFWWKVWPVEADESEENEQRVEFLWTRPLRPLRGQILTFSSGKVLLARRSEMFLKVLQLLVLHWILRWPSEALRKDKLARLRKTRFFSELTVGACAKVSLDTERRRCRDFSALSNHVCLMASLWATLKHIARLLGVFAVDISEISRFPLFPSSFSWYFSILLFSRSMVASSAKPRILSKESLTFAQLLFSWLFWTESLRLTFLASNSGSGLPWLARCILVASTMWLDCKTNKIQLSKRFENWLIRLQFYTHGIFTSKLARKLITRHNALAMTLCALSPGRKRKL